MYTYIYIDTHTFIHIHTHVYIHMYTYICIYTSITLRIISYHNISYHRYMYIHTNTYLLYASSPRQFVFWLKQSRGAKGHIYHRCLRK